MDSTFHFSSQSEVRLERKGMASPLIFFSEPGLLVGSALPIALSRARRGTIRKGIIENEVEKRAREWPTILKTTVKQGQTRINAMESCSKPTACDSSFCSVSSLVLTTWSGGNGG